MARELLCGALVVKKSGLIAVSVLLIACGDAPKMSNLSGGVSAGGSATVTAGSDSDLTSAGGTEATSGEGSGATSGESDGDSSGPNETESGEDSASGTGSASGTSTGGEGSSGAEVSTTSSTTGGSEESGSTGGGLIGPDGVLDITIYGANDCTFTTDPAEIVVPEGTGFTVNWINHASSEVEVDVAKIDQFNSVPILIGLEIGNSHHDDVREWCGDLFSGTFSFRVTSCHEPHYIDVDCGG